MTHKLIDRTTGEEITLPAKRKCWDGSIHEIQSFRTSRFEGNEGYVSTAWGETYVPSILGAKIAPANEDSNEGLGAGSLK